MKNILSFRLFENPDSIKSLGLSFLDKDCVTFGYLDGIMLVGLDVIHSDLIYDIYDDDDDIDYDYFYEDDGTFKRDVYDYPGRLWLDSKVISFWIYPKKEELKTVLEDIKKAFDKKYPDLKSKLDFNDPDWKIEVIEDFKDPDNPDWQNHEYNTQLVPISKYIGSKNRSEEELKAVHLLSWAEKQELKKKGWGKGWGSDLTAWDGKNPLWWRQAKYQESYKFKI